MIAIILNDYFSKKQTFILRKISECLEISKTNGPDIISNVILKETTCDVVFVCVCLTLYAQSYKHYAF